MTLETTDRTSNELQEALGTFVRERRLALGLTQTQLAERLGWVQERVSLIENGKYGLPSLLALARVATALELRPFELLAAAGYDQYDVSNSRETGETGARSAACLHVLQRLLAIPATSLKESLMQTADLLGRVTRADKIDVLAYESHTDSLVALGTSNTPMGRREIEIGMDRFPLPNGGREVEVFATGVPYHSDHARDDPGMLVGVTDGLGVQSIIIEPFDVGGTRRGVLIAESSCSNVFGEGDQAFIPLLARWVGMIAERAELVERVTSDAVEQAHRTTAEELMTVLAHDLNNHLTPLQGHIDLLRRRAERDGRENDVQGVHEATLAIERIQQLNTTLLDAARLDAGVFGLSPAPVDLVELIRDVARRQEEEEHPFELRLPEYLPVWGDASRLCQSLENLVSNAQHHSPGGVPIKIVLTLETRHDGEWAVIAVQDEGPGVAAELVPTLFERFSKDTRSHGLGLGLYLARGVAYAHGGDLTVESEVGMGATFRLSLPPGSTSPTG